VLDFHCELHCYAAVSEADLRFTAFVENANRDLS
jgi:hypothetical protein